MKLIKTEEGLKRLIAADDWMMGILTSFSRSTPAERS